MVNRFLLKDLEVTVTILDELMIKLEKQGPPSKKDIAQLKESLFHLDALIVKLKNLPQTERNQLTEDIIDSLTSAAKHLRKVLHEEKATRHIHSDEKNQQHNDKLFTSLIRQIKRL